MKTYLLLIASGILSGLSVAYEGLGFLAFFSLAPFIYILYKKGGRYLYAFAYGMGYYGVLYFWFTYMHPMDFAGMDGFISIFVVCLGWLGMSLLQSAELGFLAVFYQYIGKKSRVLGVLALAFSWIFVEWFQSLGFWGVPICRISLSQAGNIFGIQSASIFGGYFISFVLVLINALIACVFTLEGRKKKLIAAGLAVSVFSANQIFGAVCIAAADKPVSTVTAMAVQGNISSKEKTQIYSISRTYEIYEALTLDGIEKGSPGLILWPETVMNVTMKYYPDLMADISNIAKDSGAVIFTGTFDETEGDEGTEAYNAVCAFYPNGEMSETGYYKRHLVPFGEYIPLADIISKVLPLFTDYDLTADSLTAGRDSAVFDTEYGKVGALICFDSIYEDLTRESVLDGAELLITSTNESWCGNSTLAYQHHSHSVMRAVESGRYMLRSASTGISSVIDCYGRVLDSLPLDESGYVCAEVEMRDSMTFYTLTGNLIIYVAAAYIVLSLGYTAVKSRKDNKSNKNGI